MKLEWLKCDQPWNYTDQVEYNWFFIDFELILVNQ